MVGNNTRFHLIQKFQGWFLLKYVVLEINNILVDTWRNKLKTNATFWFILSKGSSKIVHLWILVIFTYCIYIYIYTNRSTNCMKCYQTGFQTMKWLKRMGHSISDVRMEWVAPLSNVWGDGSLKWYEMLPNDWPTQPHYGHHLIWKHLLYITAKNMSIHGKDWICWNTSCYYFHYWEQIGKITLQIFRPQYA